MAPRVVTILTPTLNASRYLRECLSSIATQTYPRDRIQHLVLDGASEDDTADIIANESPTSELHVQRDSSLYEALNRGIAIAQGEITGWLNADDMYLPDAVESASKVFDAHPEVSVVVGNFELFAGDRGDLTVTRADPLARIRRGWRRGAWVTPLAVFFRTAVLRELGGYDPSYRVASDLDLWIRAAARSPKLVVRHSGATVGRFRVHPQSLSKGVSPERCIRETIAIARRWSEDASAPRGVRRYALCVQRQYEFMLAMWLARGRPWTERARVAFATVLRFRPFGPGVIWDVRPELQKLILEIAQ